MLCRSTRLSGVAYSELSITAISDYEFYINNSSVIDVQKDSVLFSFDKADYESVPVGLDHIVYIKDNAIEIIKWRSAMWSANRTNEGTLDPSVYPNPATDYFSTKLEVSNLTISNIHGSIVSEFNSSKTIYDISDLKPGIYQVKITDAGNKTYTSKLIKK